MDVLAARSSIAPFVNPPPRALCQSSQVHRISPTAARLPDQSDFGSLCKDGEKTSLSDYSFSTLARLRTLRSDLIYPTIAVHHGRIVKRTGDGSIIEFRSVVDAVRCAIEVQSGLAERNAGLPPEKRIEFRVGIHLGDVVEESDGDLMGDGVNIAARLEGVAKPNAICLSEQAYWLVKGRLDLKVNDLGHTQLKNIAELRAAARAIRS